MGINTTVVVLNDALAQQIWNVIYSDFNKSPLSAAKQCYDRVMEVLE